VSISHCRFSLDIFERVLSVSCYKNPAIRARGLLSTLIIAHLGDRDYRIIHAVKRPNLPLEWTSQLYRAALYENEKNRRDGEAGERSPGWLSGLNQSSSCSCFSHPARRRYQAPSPFSRTAKEVPGDSRSGRAIFPWELTNLSNRRS